MKADSRQGTRDKGPRTRYTAARRGVTLIEMLVTVAILVLIMTVVAQVFQAATGAMSTAQALSDLDGQLRRLESVIRADLGGATASFTPAPNYPAGPFGLDPGQNEGYFEYGENEFADNQGEDSDDYIKFTAKAPAGQPFTGRMFLPPPGGSFANMNQAQIQNYLTTQPITITSDYAEIIYFLRNGNLYRRVLLIAPQLQTSIYQVTNNQDPNVNATPYNGFGTTSDPFTPVALGNPNFPAFSGVFPISWQGVNDLSARPLSRGSGLPPNNSTIVLNTLGDLTNRENRFASPRFSDDFLTLGPPSVAGGGATWSAGPDGLYDDTNDDNLPDLYPTLYPGVFNTGLIFAPNYQANNSAINLLAFPFIYPGAYSEPQNLANGYQLGWIHSPNPQVFVNNNGVTYDNNPSVYLQYLNHNPLDLGDNLPVPPPGGQPAFNQTWWGFPTWRETLSYVWNDPTWQINLGGVQPNGLIPLAPSNVPVVPPDHPGFLPAMTATWRGNPQLYTEGAGTASAFFPTTTQQLWLLWQYESWEDDLIMTNVRSFDVKAYDNYLSGYADLGWGDDPRVTSHLIPTLLGTNSQIPFLGGNPDYSGNNHYPPLVQINGQWCSDYIGLTFAHEGRMPPLTTDQRYDAHYGPGSYSGNNNYNGNIGDNQNTTLRLRRVWDSWSTEYSEAPGTGQTVNTTTGIVSPAGYPFGPPVYPSYPPPYPAQLRAIQIQIRVMDTAKQHVKSITIRQDFTEKL